MLFRSGAIDSGGLDDSLSDHHDGANGTCGLDSSGEDVGLPRDLDGANLARGFKPGRIDVRISGDGDRTYCPRTRDI